MKDRPDTRASPDTATIFKDTDMSISAALLVLQFKIPQISGFFLRFYLSVHFVACTVSELKLCFNSFPLKLLTVTYVNVRQLSAR